MSNSVILDLPLLLRRMKILTSDACSRHIIPHPIRSRFRGKLDNSLISIHLRHELSDRVDLIFDDAVSSSDCKSIVLQQYLVYSESLESRNVFPWSSVVSIVVSIIFPFAPNQNSAGQCWNRCPLWQCVVVGLFKLQSSWSKPRVAFDCAFEMHGAQKPFRIRRFLRYLA